MQRECTRQGPLNGERGSVFPVASKRRERVRREHRESGRLRRREIEDHVCWNLEGRTTGLEIAEFSVVGTTWRNGPLRPLTARTRLKSGARSARASYWSYRERVLRMAGGGIAGYRASYCTGQERGAAAWQRPAAETRMGCSSASEKKPVGPRSRVGALNATTEGKTRGQAAGRTSEETGLLPVRRCSGSHVFLALRHSRHGLLRP